MGVVFKGGTSGDRYDYLPPVPNSGSPQPVLDTSGGGSNSNLQWGINASNPGNTDSDGKFDPQVPLGGTIPTGSTDVYQQDINQDFSAQGKAGTLGADNGIFMGAPNYGTKGGPATPGN